MTSVISAQPNVDMDDIFIVESMTASAPPSIARASIEGHLQACDGRIAIIVPAEQNEGAPASAEICSFPMAIRAHHGRAFRTRFHFDIDWHADDAKYPNIHGRVTVGGLGVKTELVFKGWYEIARASSDTTRSDDGARAIVRRVLSQFKAVLEKASIRGRGFGSPVREGGRVPDGRPENVQRMSDRPPDFPLRELHAAAGEKSDLHNRIDALRRELDANPPVRASIDSHVRELRKHASLATLVANWFDDPRTQAFIDEIAATGL